MAPIIFSYDKILAKANHSAGWHPSACGQIVLEAWLSMLFKYLPANNDNMSLNLISSVYDKISLTANIRANATEESSVHRKETACHGNSGMAEKLKKNC